MSTVGHKSPDLRPMLLGTDFMPATKSGRNVKNQKREILYCGQIVDNALPKR